MDQHYILVEGINIYANVFDTNQLSVIRGSSFLLKRAIDHITDTFADKLTPLSTGASSGLYLVNHEVSVVTISTKIVEELNQPEQDFNLFTFVVEHCSANNLLQAKEQLIAQLRIRQMQSLTLAPDVSDEARIELNQPDELEGRRIAVAHRDVTIQKKPRKLSHSVLRRWDYGKDLKQTYYFQENENLKELKQYNFSENFEDLADNKAYSKLNGKIAVIYIDGNRFSQIQKKILQDTQSAKEDLVKAQEGFDKTIQNNRSELLLGLLLAMIDVNSESGFKHSIQLQENRKILRLETLLWGGDEMLFVLPAWLGFELIHYFFDKTKDWKIDEQSLTHAAGMVFCSAKTPIRNIQELAKSLADTLKEVEATQSLNNKSGRDQNAWSYIILESIDYPTNSNIDDFNKKHYGSLANTKPKLIPASDNWNIHQPTVNKLFNSGILSRRQLYRIVQAITAPEADTENSDLSWEQLKISHIKEHYTAQETQELRLLEVTEHKYKQELIDSLPCLATELFSLDIENPQQRIWLWIYLYELWDYICPETNDQKEGELQ